MKFTYKISGMDDVNERINNMLQAPRTNVGVVAPGYNTKGEPIPRYANSQRKAGRDPWFFDSSEDAEATRELVAMCDAWVSRRAGEFMARLKALAAKFPDAARKHIRQGRSVDGPMAPLSERYAKIKEHVRNQGTTILVATGALITNMMPVFKVRTSRG